MPAEPPPRLAPAEAKPKAVEPSPGSAAAPVLAGKAEEGKKSIPDPVFSPPQRLLPAAVWLPWSRLESSCAKCTWPSPSIAQTPLCPCQFGAVLREPRLTSLKIHGVFLPLLLIDPLRGLGDKMGSGTEGRRMRRKAPPFPDAFVVPLAGTHIYSCLGFV